MSASSPDPITFSLANSVKELNRMSMVLDDMRAAWELAHHVVLQLNLALDELFTNVVTHGLDNGIQKEIVFTIELRDRELEITMCDEGAPFDPTKPADPDFTTPLAEKEIGGLGIFLARQYTDSIRYKRENDRNYTTLTKQI